MQRAAKARLRRILVISGICLLLLTGAGFGLSWLRAGRDRDGATKDRYFAVARGSFNIVVTLDGTLDAIKHHNLKCDARGRYGRLEIIEHVDDNTYVQSGDIVMRFSDTRHKKEEEDLVATIEDERKELLLAEKDLQMAQIANVNTIKFATDALRASRTAFTRYKKEDAPRRMAGLVSAIDTANASLEAAQRAVSDAEAAASDSRSDDESRAASLKAEVLQAEQAAERALREQESAYYNLQVFKRYTHPEKLKALEEDVTKNYMTLQRELADAAAGIIKAEKLVDHRRIRLATRETELKKLQEDIDKLKITAPVAGIVTFATRQYPWQELTEIKVGAEIMQMQVVGSIPDLSKFLVRVNIPEEYRSRVKKDLTASLRCKAVPDLALNGKVTSISPMAVHVLHWDESSPKIYPAEISTDKADERLMPGMTVRAEIIVEEVKDVLYVPVEAVYSREGKTRCKVKTIAGLKEREVEAGRSSNDYVEILSGLEEGEEVFLHREQINTT